MIDDNRFLAALRANPADRVSKLVYADWLEERGDPRAEFLRVAVTLDGMARENESYRPLLRLLHELRSTVSSAWVADVEKTLAEDEVREAIFLDLIGEGRQCGICFLQVEGGADPSDYLLDRLQKWCPFARPASSMPKDAQGFVVADAQTGQSGILFQVDALDWIDTRICAAQGGYYLDPLAALGNSYRVELQGETWKVVEVSMIWIS